MRTSLAALAAALLGLGTAAALSHGPARPSPATLRQGGRIYAAECAACHGAHLEGQPNWRQPGADGLLPAPPHDASGHTWQHSDAELTALVAQGPAATAPPGYRSAMPAYAGRLTPAQIAAVLSYIKSTWPAPQRAWQAAQNPGGPAFADLVATLPPDWVFPASCDYRSQPE